MKQFSILITGILLCYTRFTFAQYEFSGYVDQTLWPGEISLSLVQDYRKLTGIYPEQVIQKTTPDTTGYFVFSGTNLPLKNNFYKIHLENCSEHPRTSYHLNGACPNSKEIYFIANNSDRLSLPFTLDNEMFCTINSKNEKTKALVRMDSVIEEMTFSFGLYRGKTSREINTKKWFEILQQFGQHLGDPLAELYGYSYLSNKSNELYTYYLKDLLTNPYYHRLSKRLHQSYPNSEYTQKYETELAADYFVVTPRTKDSRNMWLWGIGVLLTISIMLNIFFTRRQSKGASNSRSSANLTPQEKRILELILEDQSNKEIATIMFISVSTVKTHINNLYKKLNITSREELKSMKIKGN